MPPLIELPPDETAITSAYINEVSNEIGAFLADKLTRVMDRANVDLSGFFSDDRIGTNGGALLATLSAHIQFLATHYPHRMNGTLGRAGLHLTVHPDGTVTYDPPPEEPPGEESPAEPSGEEPSAPEEEPQA